MARLAELERRLLGAALLGMAVAALGVGLWLGWRFLSAPSHAQDAGAVSTRDLAPGAFKLVEAAPPTGDAARGRTKWLLLRGADGVVRL